MPRNPSEIIPGVPGCPGSSAILGGLGCRVASLSPWSLSCPSSPCRKIAFVVADCKIQLIGSLVGVSNREVTCWYGFTLERACSSCKSALTTC